MGEIMEAVQQCLQEDGWPMLATEGESAVSFRFRGDSGRWDCYAEAREEQSQFLFYSVCPVPAPVEKRAAVAEFLTRANYGIVMGNFEMDYEDGEIRCKTAARWAHVPVTPDLVRDVIYSNLMLMDFYLSGLMKVIYGVVAPAQAVVELEGAGGGHAELTEQDELAGA